MIIVVLIAMAVVLLAVNYLSVLHPFSYLDVDLHFDRNSAQPDEPFYMYITFTNYGRLPIMSVDATMRFSGDMYPCDEQWMKEHCTESMGDIIYRESTWLMPQQKLTVKVPLQASHRGKFVAGSLFITVGDLLGLKTVTESYHSRTQIVIIPAKANIKSVQDSLGGFFGDQSIKRYIYEDPIMIEGYGDYTGHEPMKQISWMQSAKKGSLVVRKYDHTAESKVLLILDTEEADGKTCEALYSYTRSVMEILDRKKVAYAFATNANTVIDLQKSMMLGQGPMHTRYFLQLLGKAVYGEQMSLLQLTKQVEKSNETMQGVLLLTSKKSSELTMIENRLNRISNTKVYSITVGGQSL